MASIFKSFPALGRAAPRLTRQFFTCAAASKAASRAPASRPTLRAIQRSAIADALRETYPSLGSPVRRNITSSTRKTAEASQSSSSPLGRLSETIGGKQASSEAASEAAKPAFPEVSDRVVGIWLLASAASVFGIVVFGGLTRLTESGLSITEWRPVTGSMPPTTQADWESEFTKYKTSPEYIKLNPHMDLEAFKKIYWMEWIHRLWGRVIGVTVLLPTVYFIARRRVSASMALKLTGITGLIGLQGFIGWWMVASGLKDDLFAPEAHPRVSQYRLTTHLGLAFIVYSAMLMSGLSILREHKILKDPIAAQKQLQAIRSPQLRILRGSVAALVALVFITAMSGGLVAGLDAGLIYNEFPYMGLGLTPPKKELFDPFYSHVQDRSDLWWRNALENPSLVQLDHRILATATFTAIMALMIYARRSPVVKAAMPANVRKGVMGLHHLAWMQVTLGITTLIYLVPTWLASAHQAGSLALLTMALVLGHRLRMPRSAVRLLEKELRIGIRHGSAMASTTSRGVGPAVGSIEQRRV